MENKDPLFLVLRGLTAQVESIDKQLREQGAILMQMSQQVKHLLFSNAKEAEPFHKAPRGESNLIPCERCGAMTYKESILNKSELKGRDIFVLKLCKKCFYGKREVSSPSL